MLITIMCIALDLGIHMDQFTTMPIRIMWHLAYSTKHVVPERNLLICPGSASAKLLGLQTGCYLLPIIVCPINPSSIMEGSQALF